VSAKEIAYTFSHRVAGKSKLGRSKSIPITARDIGVLYLKKYRRMIKYALVGALGTSIYLGILALFTEVFGVWYIASALIGSGIAFFFNYTFNRLWTFNTKDFKCTDPDYEYQAWYSGSLIQKLWKRRIAGISLDVLAGCKRVLDLGCGSSPLLSRLPGKVTGIDCNAGKVAYQRTRCPESVELIVCDLSDGSVPSYPGEFDGVVCNNLLEHLEDPERVVTYAVESMKPGGRLVVTVPDSSLKATSLVERLYGKVMPGAYAHTHCFEFTQEALDRMCTSKGLSLVDRKHVFTDMVCIYRRDK
jgi:2-polyprenyl-3-methyl-5-hydroxy-6-metoxy-1,4-benzoquinol methylase